MYSYTSNLKDLYISQPITRKSKLTKHPNPLSISDKEKPKYNLNYYNHRRKDIRKLNSIGNNHNSNIDKRYITPIRSNNNSANSTLNQISNIHHKHPSIYLSHNNLLKKEFSSTTIKPKENDDETFKLKKENDFLKRENSRLKEEIDNIERSSQQITQENKNELEGIRLNLYEQLEKSKNEIKIFEKNKEILNEQITRYKKEIQKLIEDNIKLKSINQEKNIIINSTNNSLLMNGFVIRKESSFSYMNTKKREKLFKNINILQKEMKIRKEVNKNKNNIDELVNVIEKENYVLFERILDLEKQVDGCLQNKEKNYQNEKEKYGRESILERNVSDNQLNGNKNEICSLLYEFYTKIAQLLNKSIIEFESIELNKKMFMISTSSMLTEIKTYQLMLQKTTFNNYLKK